MKSSILQKAIFLLLAFLLQQQLLSAQGIYQLWGSTPYGGADDKGTFFTTKFDGTGHTVKKYFKDINQGSAVSQNGFTEWNNKLYSILNSGGIAGNGIITEYDPATNIYTKKADLFSIACRGSNSKLTLYNGKLYGLGLENGVYNGSLFVYDPVTESLIKKYTFEDATGTVPNGDLTVYNNKLYGVTRNGGQNGDGVIFEFDPATDIYKMKASFKAETTGSLSQATLIVYDNKLWGASSSSKGVNKGGYIFSFDPATNILSPKVELGTIGAKSHHGSLAILNNKFYGMTETGGADNMGILFQYDPATNILIKEKEMSASTSNHDLSMISYNGLLYGAGAGGGGNDMGVLFTYEPISNTYTNKVTFSEGIGQSAKCLVEFQNKMYFWTTNGGQYKTGSLNEYIPATNQLFAKINLGSDDFWYPTGNMLYYNNKIYGLAYDGGKTKNGGVFQYDPVTDEYSIKLSLSTYSISEGSYLTLYNNKFYGVCLNGGAANMGSIFVYDPIANTFQNIFEFDGQNGSSPYGKLLVYNNKMLCITRADEVNQNGTLFSFDPSNNTLITKVIFNDIRGKNPGGNLSEYKGRIFGTASSGGVNGHGTLYEYLPLANGLTKLADFNKPVTGSSPSTGVTGFNNKLYGATSQGDISLYWGSIYEYDLSNGVLSKKVQLDNVKGNLAIGDFTLLNNKLYGMTSLGGNYPEGGVLFEYDPTINLYTKKVDFTAVNGRFPWSNQLNPLPAQVAPGVANNCSVSNDIKINAANANEWIPFTDSEGRAIAEINANGNLLGTTIVSYYINKGAVRQYNGFYYLDRSITFRTENEAVSPVSIRLYIRRGEFETLKTALSGNLSIDELRVFKNDDICDGAIVNPATAIEITSGAWATDYVFSASTADLKTFYFAQKNSVLPIRNIMLKGEKQTNSNKLIWQVSCTSGAEFTLEKSTDGQTFLAATTIAATALECKKEFSYHDDNVTNGKTYYRLKIVENGGSPTYSKIIVIDRDGSITTKIKVIPNPVTDGILKLQVENGKPGNATISIIDMAGKKLLIKNFNMATGMQIIQIGIGQLAKGMYAVSYSDANGKLVSRLVKN